MSGNTVSIEDLLNHPDTKNVISELNWELIERREYAPNVCEVFSQPFVVLKDEEKYRFDIHPEAEKLLPNIISNKVQRLVGMDVVDDDLKAQLSRKRNIGVVFSGGPAPGGHNVIGGLYDAAKKANPESRLWGFLVGPDGVIEGESVEITQELVDKYRNLGGFSMIKTGRTKIDTDKKVSLAREACKRLNLDALVIIGGDDSNTNAAFLAESMKDDNIQVIGVPKTIDGDIQVRTADGDILCAMSFGFHSAARSFAKNISDLCIDSSSDIKYWHICKVMGRVASHLALEVGLQTHANLTLIGEELADYVDEKKIDEARITGEIDYSAFGMTLRHLSRLICNTIVKRAMVGKNYGVIVIPEGILEFINEIQTFIIKLNSIISEFNDLHDTNFHQTFPLLDDKLEYLRRLVRGIRVKKSNIWNERDHGLFCDLPAFFQEGLLTERDSHGNFQFSQVETERVLLEMVKDYLSILIEKGRYKIGLGREWYRKTLQNDGLDPDYFGPILFRNYNEGAFLLMKDTIFSKKTLKLELKKAGATMTANELPDSILGIYQKSIPKFKTQSHFYGYDGRGCDPTRFDCNYTYNLGMTVFSLIANGATAQMASIKNLENDFGDWEPIGIPIAPLMHLEERKGKLALVIEKSVVDLESNAFRVIQALRNKWMGALPGEDAYRRPGPVRFKGRGEEDRPITLVLNALEVEEKK